MRYARVDDNQKAIVAGLRKAGCSVAITSGVGKGFPDLICGFRDVNYMFEVKDPTKPRADRQLTKDQVIFHVEWKGQIAIIESAEQAFHVMGLTPS